MLKRHYFVVETVAVKNCFKPPRAGFFAIQWHLMTFDDISRCLFSIKPRKHMWRATCFTVISLNTYWRTLL